jgi:hypothetical protein
MNARLELRCVGIDPIPPRYFLDVIDALLLGMKNDDWNREQRIDDEDDNPGGSPNSCSQRDGKCDTGAPAVEKNREGSGEHDAEQWNHSQENSEQTGLERGPSGRSRVDDAGLRQLIRLRE